jgi:hypothetical protein
VTRHFRIFAVVGVIALLCLGWITVTGFFSRLYFVMATRGLHGEQYHEEYLRKAIAMNPSYGYANLDLARLMMRRRIWSSPRISG